MSAIAYITDSKMLELHRLNNHKTINFWRPSAKINFSDFGVGDLVFFLSKDKNQKKSNEKGIVGFGRVKEIKSSSIKNMWDKHGKKNGYRTYDDFKEAIRKVSKDRLLPRKISAFLLDDVIFFQPIYLSESGYAISNKVESYIYLRDDELIFNIFDTAKSSGDLWSNYEELNDIITKQQTIYALNATHKIINDIEINDKQKKKARKTLSEYLVKGYEFVKDSDNEIYCLNNNRLEIMYYVDKDTDDKKLLGQSQLYRYYIKDKFKMDCDIIFSLSDNNREIINIINNI